jgi:asparagine synthetase A
MEFLSDEKKKLLHTFTKFVKEKLELESVPTIVIQNGNDGLKTTANYDYTKENKIIKVNGKNRALVDVMRSLAHEMTHHKQYEEGRLTNSNEDGADGSDIENEAHAVAGLIMRKFTNIHPKVYDEIK